MTTSPIGINVSKGKQGNFFTLNADGKNTTNTNGHTIPTAVKPVEQSTTTTDPNAFMATMMRGQMMQQMLSMAFQGLGAMGPLFANAFDGEKETKNKKNSAKDTESKPKTNTTEVASAQEEWKKNPKTDSPCANGQCQLQ